VTSNLFGFQVLFVLVGALVALLGLTAAWLLRRHI
jgi:hypothetical protein